METYKPNVSKWEAHFRAMANGDIHKNGNVTIVRSPTKSDVGAKLVPQKGAGLTMVTPIKQVVEMAKAKKRKALKEKKRAAKPIRRIQKGGTKNKAKKPPMATALKRRRKQ